MSGGDAPDKINDRETGKGYKMQDKLMRCFYDGMSKDEAVAFIERAYGVKVKDVSVKTAVNKIKTMTGKDW